MLQILSKQLLLLSDNLPLPPLRCQVCMHAPRMMQHRHSIVVAGLEGEKAALAGGGVCDTDEEGRQLVELVGTCVHNC